jgi:glycerol uptake facilitator-like aquaporin
VFDRGWPLVLSDLVRRAAAELVGTGILVATVVGSGIAAAALSPGDVGLQLLENSLATGAVLVALILALQPVSAAFNPVVTLIERAFGALTNRETVVLVVAQFAGGAMGCIAANLMFALPVVSISQHERSTSGLWLAEVIATAGLALVVFGTVRSGRSESVAYAVGAYITAAYWFTASTSFANPAVTSARMLSDTFAGIHPGSVPMFIAMQAVGGVFGYLLVRVMYAESAALAAELTHAEPTRTDES